MNKEVVKVDILKVLQDSNNTQPIIMYNENGEEIIFEQIAVIPYGEKELYCILKPITKVEGIKDEEAVVFKVVQGDKDTYLKVEENQSIALEIFGQYYNLIEEEVEIADKETILSVIKNDINLQNISKENNEIIDFAKLDLHPFRYQDKLYAIIKETSETDFSEALVWKVETIANGQKRLVWVENEQLENFIISMYLRRHQNDRD